MKITTWSIINNEIDYLPDIVPYHLQLVDQMYFLDTGSTDGSLQYLQEQSKINNKIIVEQYHISYTPDYSVEWKDMENPFPEVEVRNYALERAKTLKSDWLIQLDGDEIFLPTTKNIIETAIRNNKQIITIPTINPVETLDKHPLEKRTNSGQIVDMHLKLPQLLHDPHARIWKSNLDIKFINNPAFGKEKQFHCIPVKNGKHVYHAPENIFIAAYNHYHLHWMYGKKVEDYFNKLGINDKNEIASNQKLNQYAGYVPKLFWDRRREWINTSKELISSEKK